MWPTVPKKPLSENIAFTITINIVIATAISVFMDTTVYEESFPSVLSQYYGLSIVCLIFCYIFLQMNSERRGLTFEESTHLNDLLLLNLFLTNVLFAIAISPSILRDLVNTNGDSALVYIISIIIVVNVLIPIMILLVMVAHLFEYLVETQRNKSARK